MEFFWEIIVILIGIILAMVAYFAKDTREKLHETAKKAEQTATDLAKFETHVATNHPTHDGINRRFDQVDEKMVKISDKLDDKFDKISDKIENKFDIIQQALIKNPNIEG